MLDGLYIDGFWLMMLSQCSLLSQQRNAYKSFVFLKTGQIQLKNLESSQSISQSWCNNHQSNSLNFLPKTFEVLFDRPIWSLLLLNFQFIWIRFLTKDFGLPFKKRDYNCHTLWKMTYNEYFLRHTVHASWLKMI